MSAKWTNDELRLLVRGELHFTADDAAALLEAIARRVE